MSDINITYDLLFDILRIEKSREDLQKLDTQFYLNVVDYLNTKEVIITNPTTPIGERELTRIQLANVKRILVELYDRREKKIINLAIYKMKTGSGLLNTESLLSQEKQLFDNVYAVLSKSRNSILTNVLEGKIPQDSIMTTSQPLVVTSSKNSDLAIETMVDDGMIRSVRFIRPVPKFMGPELETYGPFEENDIASLPSKIAILLIKKSRAEEMHIN